MPSQTEIYLHSLAPTKNVVHGQVDTKGGALQADGWTQIFDLKDSVLICNVNSSELDMRLVHLTEQPLNDYVSMMQKGRLRMPGLEQNLTYLKTEDDQRDQLRSYFEQYSSAKIIVSGSIVQRLSLSQTALIGSYNENQNDNNNYYQSAPNTDFGYNTLQHRGQNAMDYSLKFATSSNKIYTIDFGKYFFSKQEGSILVQQPIDVSNRLQGGNIKAFDVVRDYQMGQEIYAVGIGLAIGGTAYQPQDTGSSGAISHNEETLYIMRHDSANGISTQLLSKQSVVGGYFKEFQRTIKQITPSLLFSGGGHKKITNLSEQRVSSKATTEEGVVAVHTLSNGLITVIYSSGLLRIWSIYSGALISEYDLLDQGDQENRDQLDAQQKAFDRIVSAKLTYLGNNHTSDDVGFQKQFQVSVAYKVQSFKTFSSQWNLAKFSLYFQNLPLNIDDTNDNKIDLGNEAELSMIMSQQLGANISVTNILFEKEQHSQRNYLWVTTFNEKEKESQIIDMNASSALVWDKNSQTKYYQFTDQVELSQELQDRPFSPYQQAMKKYLYKRLTKRNRFSQALQEYIRYQAEQLKLKDGLSISDQIKRVCEKCEVADIKLIIKNVTKIENQNSRITGISQKLSSIPIRIVVRPLGISVLKDDTSISRAQNTAKAISIALAQNQHNLSSSQIISALSTGNSNGLLIFKLLGSIKFMLGSTLSLVDEQIASNPASTRDILKTAIRESYNYESLQQELIKMIEQGQDQIEYEQRMLTEHIVSSLLNNFAQSGKGLSNRFVYPQLASEYSYSVIKLIERGLLNDIDNLYETLRDLAILKTYIQTYIPLLIPNDQQIRYEWQSQEMLFQWLKQIAALKAVLNKNLDTSQIKEVGNDKKFNKSSSNDILTSYESNGKASILQYLLCKDQSILTAYQSKGQTQLNDTLGALIQAYTYKYPLLEQTYIPYLVRKLDQLQQWKALDKYLNIQDDTTIGMDFLRAYTSAKIGNNPSDFIKYINMALTKFATLGQLEVLDYTQLIIKQSKSSEHMKRVRSVTKNQSLQFYLTILEQIGDLDGRYSIYLIKQALQMCPYLQTKESDYLYQVLFQMSRVGTSLDYMFLACNKIQDQNARKRTIGQFLERLCVENAQHYLTTNCFFSQDDIDLALQWIYDQIEQVLSNSKNQNRVLTYSLKWRKDTEQLVKLLNLIAKVYSRSQEVCRFLWYSKVSLEALINKEILNFDNQQSKDSKINDDTTFTNVQEMLSLQDFILKILLENALVLGESFIMTDNAHIQHTNKKRKIQSISNDVDQNMTDAEKRQQKLTTDSKLSVIDKIREESKDGDFLQGVLLPVTVDDIIKNSLLAKARLQSLQYTTTSDAQLLVKVLTEFQEFDLACELALAYKEGVSYPLAQWILCYTTNQKPDQDLYLVDIEQPYSLYQHEQLNVNISIEQNDRKFINQRFQPQQRIDTLIESYLDRLSDKDVIELVQRLVTQDIKIPIQIEKQLVQRGHIVAIVEAYMSSDYLNIPQAVEVIERYLPESVQLLAATHLNLLVLLLQNIESAADACEEKIDDLKQEEANIERLRLGGNYDASRGQRSFIPAQGSAIRDISAQFNRFSDDLEQFYGSQLDGNGENDSQRAYERLAGSSEAGDNQHLIKLRAEIVLEKEILRILRQESISQALANILNGN